MNGIIVWLLFGIIASAICRASWRLAFRSPINLGTIVAWLAGIALPPLALFLALIFFCCWAFGEPEQRHMAVKWPLWWGRFRYRQHRLVRWIWHLGSPPADEDILSGWRHAPREYTQNGRGLS